MFAKFHLLSHAICGALPWVAWVILAQKAVYDFSAWTFRHGTIMHCQLGARVKRIFSNNFFKNLSSFIVVLSKTNFFPYCMFKKFYFVSQTCAICSLLSEMLNALVPDSNYYAQMLGTRRLGATNYALGSLCAKTGPAPELSGASEKHFFVQ